MGQSVILALHFLFFLLIHVLLQYLYSWIDAHSLEEVTLRNGLWSFNTMIHLCKLSKSVKVYISWKITFSWNLPEVRIWNKLMLLNCSDTVRKSMLSTVINVQNGSFCMKQ